jgi:hypothetical protein
MKIENLISCRLKKPGVRLCNQLTAASLFFLFLISGSAGFSREKIKPADSQHNDQSERNIPDERVLLVTDRTLYICGENIVFEAFTYEGYWRLPLVLSSVLYVELYDVDNTVVAKGKYILGNGKCAGNLSIPRDCRSGIFSIRAYTNFMKNFGLHQFFVSNMKIVNPFLGSSGFQSLQQENRSNESLLEISGDTSDYLKISIGTDRNEYGARDKIKVSVKVTDNGGRPVKADLSVISALSENVVSDHNPAEIPFNGPAREAEIPFKISEIQYLPEIKGDIISGRAVYADNQPAAGIKVLQSFTGKSSWIESSVTDNKGRFYFTIENEKNRGNLILKSGNGERKISLIPDDEFFNDFPPPRKEILSLTENEINLISKLFVNVQVNDAYSEIIRKKTDKTKETGSAFYGIDCQVYKFPDYLELPNMREFIFEVIQGVVYSRENRRDVLSILEENGFRKIGPDPLFIIDGVPVDDPSSVLGFPTDKVESIRVVRNKYLYKNQSFDGILDLVTYKGDASALELPGGTFRYSYVHAVKGEVKTEPEILSDVAGRIPVYRNLLYSNPDITTDENGYADFTFSAPDNSGTFEIRCLGFSPGGLFGSESVRIIVRQNQP